MTIADSAARLLPDRGVASQFLRFCVVGAVGFLVDAAILEMLLFLQLLNPFTARLFSFGCAVFATFQMNRHWSFKSGDLKPFWTTFVSYLGVQGVGFVCNFSIYSALYVFVPAPMNRPIYCLIIASAISMSLNFLGAKILVFRSR